jgi:hypothetical protein
MISLPTTGQLIRTVRTDLLETIAPTIADPNLSTFVEMMASILYVAAERAENEARWMLESSDGIYAAAAAVVAEHGDDLTALARVHGQCAEGRTDRVTPHGIRADYDRSSEVLAVFLEDALQFGDATVLRSAESLLQQRVQREREILGESFKLAGR